MQNDFMPSEGFSLLGIFIFNRNNVMFDKEAQNILNQIKNYRFLLEQDDLEENNLDVTKGDLPKDNAFFVQMQTDLSAAIKYSTVVVDYLRVDANDMSKPLVTAAGKIGGVDFVFDNDGVHITMNDMVVTDRTPDIIKTLNVYYGYKFKTIEKEIIEALIKNKGKIQ
jgi:hypothetical protein